MLSFRPFFLAILLITSGFGDLEYKVRFSPASGALI
jgi:hypothetical protein